MLNFQKQDCNTSLQEGIEEYRSYLRKNNRYVLGEQVTSKSLTFLLLLVDRGRIAFLEGITQKFLELSYKKESIEIAFDNFASEKE